jgi:hypothetical protein
MKRAGLLLALPVLLLAAPQPAAAQGFFDRLFGLPPRPQPGQPVPPQQQYRPQPQYRPQQQPQQQRRPQQPQSQRPAVQQQPPQQQAEPAPAVEPPPAPYEKELLRLAEIMGSLAMLRPLCSAPDGTEWSRRMQVLPGPARAPRRSLQQGLSGLCPHLPGVHPIGPGGFR